MFKFALAALLCAQALARPQDAEIESHIIDGTPAKEGQFPFAVSVRKVGYGFICGGALLSDRYVVTSAGCLWLSRRESFQVGVGSINVNSQKVYDVEKVILHSDYDHHDKHYNIALLRLKTPVKLGKNIQTINFPVKDNLEGKTLTAMGWGNTAFDSRRSDVLMYLNRPVIKSQECARRVGYDISETEICIDGKRNSGICSGDGGSPLVHKGSDGKTYLAGLSSWGISCADGHPDVFTRVSYFTKWIQENMA